MKKTHKALGLVLLVIMGIMACTQESLQTNKFTEFNKIFGTKIDINNLPNYANQTKPVYITKDNVGSNTITNVKASIGRILFYDKNLSVDNTVACGSCHKQAFAFSDTARRSSGVQGGLTERHSMRLINARFGDELKFFWNERASSIENQSTQPIKDHAEMGFSGLNGRATFNDLLTRLRGLKYYQEIFNYAYGDTLVTELRMQECIAQFIRSIQSFDSKYDAGRITVASDQVDFPNFTADENAGKRIFLGAPQFTGALRTSGGAGCAGCHRPPEFDILPNSGNNGIIGNASDNGKDTGVTRSPSLRDVVKGSGAANGPFMHTGANSELIAIINHYNQITAGNSNLDPKLRPNGLLQQLQLTQTEKSQLILFLTTLAGTNVYTDTKWSNPFP